MLGAIAAIGTFVSIGMDMYAGSQEKSAGKEQQKVADKAAWEIEVESDRAARAAEYEAERVADMERRETAETVRRMEYGLSRKLGTTRSLSGASGMQGASAELYIYEMERIGTEEIDWEMEIGESRAEAAISTGRELATQTRFSGSSSAAALRAGGQQAAYQGNIAMWGAMSSGVGKAGQYGQWAADR